LFDAWDDIQEGDGEGEGEGDGEGDGDVDGSWDEYNDMWMVMRVYD